MFLDSNTAYNHKSRPFFVAGVLFIVASSVCIFVPPKLTIVALVLFVCLYLFFLKPEVGMGFLILCRVAVDSISLEYQSLNAGGVEFNVSGALNIVLLISCSMYLIFTIPTKKILTAPAAKEFGIFLIYCLVSLCWAIDVAKGFSFFLRVFGYFSIYLTAYWLQSRQKTLTSGVTAIAWIGFIISLTSCLLYINGFAFEQPSLLRASYPFANPSDLAMYLSFVLPVILFVWLRKATFLAIESILFGICFLTVFLTYLRASWLGVILSGVIILIYIAQRHRLLVLVLAASLVAGSVLTPAFTERLSDPGSFYSRIDLWNSILPLVKVRPYFGYGIGSIGGITAENFLIPYFISIGAPLPEQYGMGAHNDFISILVETGLVGLCLFVLLFYRLIRNAFKLYVLVPNVRFLIIVLLSIVSSYIFQSIFSNMLASIVAQWNFWFLFGAILAFCSSEGLDKQQRRSDFEPK